MLEQNLSGLNSHECLSSIYLTVEYYNDSLPVPYLVNYRALVDYKASLWNHGKGTLSNEKSNEKESI